jgi:DtxR family Mn-dependent transcriptional regulator
MSALTAEPELTRSVEDYLKAIYRLSAQGGFAATRQLQYNWDDVHDEAERLEHAVSDDLIERMAAALGDPRYDPHGDPIPTAAGEIEEAELVPLSEAAIGKELELRQVGTQDAARLRYFAEQGLVPGVRVLVTDRQPFNGPTTILLPVTGTARVVGRELAQQLWCRTAGV